MCGNILKSPFLCFSNEKLEQPKTYFFVTFLLNKQTTILMNMITQPQSTINRPTSSYSHANKKKTPRRALANKTKIIKINKHFNPDNSIFQYFFFCIFILKCKCVSICLSYRILK